jgi:FlaA1/EpsC-like NDP-sugar epimerase
MGASKKLMEEVILAYSGKMKITTARFANVAFSNGSLLDGFMERLAKQQPLSCPSDVKRFFVSPQEAGEICLCACILGDSGNIFFPKLSERDLLNFADIVPPFVKQMGFEMKTFETEEGAKKAAANILNGIYPVYFFASSTSGEKLYEEFYTDEEELNLERFKNLGIVQNAKARNISELDAIVNDIKELFEKDDVGKHEVVDLLRSMLPGFQHIETGMNLDQKM